MANYTTYNFQDHESGDTFNGKTFTFTSHPSGTLSTVQFITNSGRTLDITIVSSANWVFKIETQVIAWETRVHEYRIVTTSSTGVVKSYIRGNWKIT